VESYTYCSIPESPYQKLHVWLKKPGVPTLKLGNLDAVRDWGYAPDYVEAMWMMLQHDKPDDYIVGTEKAYLVKEFLIKAFKVVGIDNWNDFVEINEDLFRPSEVPYLKCKTDKIRNTLGWKPKVTFDELVTRMVLADVQEENKKKS
jgi:GDPmannose 4,6-dehydratase